MSKKTSKATTADNQVMQEYMQELQTPVLTFQKRQIIKGTVVEMRESEMVVNIGGRTEGYVSGKELKLDGKKVSRKTGEKVLVYVINPENEEGQVELSIRRTGTALKWYDLDKAKSEDRPIKVKVIEANTGGVIVEIGGGLRGFVPTSQLDNKRIYSTGDYQKFESKEDAKQQLQSRLADLIGGELEVMVIEIDKEKNRVILSEKLVGAEEMLQQRAVILSTLSVGDILEGEVTGIAPFGLFVNAKGIEGLVHLSEISWDKVANPADFYRPGDKVKVMVLDIQDQGKRIAFSIKRLLEDPWDEIVKNYKIGQVIDGEITKVVDYGAFVRVDEGLNGLIHISELSDKLVKDPNELVKLGDNVKVKIISMSKEDRHLGLSVKRLKAEASGSKPEAGIAPEMAELQKILDNND